MKLINQLKFLLVAIPFVAFSHSSQADESNSNSVNIYEQNNASFQVPLILKSNNENLEKNEDLQVKNENLSSAETTKAIEKESTAVVDNQLNKTETTLAIDNQLNKTETAPLNIISQEKNTTTINSNISETKTKQKIEADNDSIKAFQEKKNYLQENKSTPSLWQGASLVFAFISLIGIISYFITRFHKNGVFNKNKQTAIMNILSTLSISPKRQIMLLQVRDKEIVICNTESGIHFISDLGSQTLIKESVIEKKPFQIANYIKPATPIANEEAQIHKNKEAEVHSINEKKSDILLKALKRLEKESPKETHENKPEEVRNELSEANAKFPKYFSNIFETEAKKEIKKKEDSDSVENVTSLIREKLRSMKPLN
jgi:flagellar biogenesis protein FliO